MLVRGIKTPNVDRCWNCCCCCCCGCCLLPTTIAALLAARTRFSFSKSSWILNVAILLTDIVCVSVVDCYSAIVFRLLSLLFQKRQTFVISHCAAPLPTVDFLSVLYLTLIRNLLTSVLCLSLPRSLHFWLLTFFLLPEDPFNQADAQFRS